MPTPPSPSARSLPLLALLAALWPGIAPCGAAQEPDPFLDTLTPEGRQLCPTDEATTLYQIHVVIDSTTWTYAGQQKVTYTNNEEVPLDRLLFHVVPNAEFLQEKGEGPNVRVTRIQVDGTPVEGEERATQIAVPLPRPLRPGETTALTLRFRGKLPALKEPGDLQEEAMEQLMNLLSGDATGGMLQGNFGIFGISGPIASMALWHPILATYDENGWDEGAPTQTGDFSYFDAADWLVSIRTDPRLEVVAPGWEISTETAGDDQVVTFAAGRIREFTLQLSPAYESTTADVEGIAVRSWYLRGHQAKGLDVLRTAARSVSVYNRRFGPYPYTDLNVVEAPLFGGVAGVEFPRLCTIATMFYAPAGEGGAGLMGMGALPPGFLDETLEFVVAHEVAHQWWNATIGSDSRRHPFVDEAMANFGAMVYYEDTYGKARSREVTDIQIKLNYHMARMMGIPDAPVDRSTEEFSDPVQYVAMVYAKGAMYFDALRKLAGDEVFFPALQEHYRDHYLQVAHPRDLPEAVKRRAPHLARQIDAQYERWIHGTHGDEDMGRPAFGKLLTTMFQGTGMLGEEDEYAPLVEALGALLDLMNEEGGLEDLLEGLDGDW